MTHDSRDDDRRRDPLVLVDFRDAEKRLLDRDRRSHVPVVGDVVLLRRIPGRWLVTARCRSSYNACELTVRPCA